MTFQTVSRFLAWLVARIAEHLHTEAAEPVREGTTLQPAAGGQMSLQGTEVVRTPRQSNLQARPGTPIATTVVDRPRALGDTPRRKAPVMHRPRGVNPPAGLYPLDPPTPFRPLLGDGVAFYRPASGLFEAFDDPASIHSKRYGLAVDPVASAGSVLNQAGASIPIPYGGQIVNGIRDFFYVQLPWLEHAYRVQGDYATTQRPQYVHIGGSGVVAGLPLPYWSLVDPTQLVCYSDSTFISNFAPAVSHDRVAEDEAVGLITGAEAGVQPFHATVETERIENVGAEHSESIIEVVFRWLPYDPGDPTSLGDLRVLYQHQMRSITLEGYEDEDLHTSTWDPVAGTAAYQTQAEAEQALREKALFYQGASPVPTTDMVVHDWPRPETWRAGTYSLRHETDADGFGGTYWLSLTYGAKDGHTVYGAVFTNSEYEAETGEPLPGDSVGSGDDVIQGGFMVILPPESREMRMVNTDSVWGASYVEGYARTLALNIPIMFQSEHGSIPRPHATATGSWCGIPWTSSGVLGSERFVCCDALEVDDELWGVVLEQDADGSNQVLTISREGEVVHTGTMLDVAPTEVVNGPEASLFNGAQVAYPHQRWQVPDWPHKQAAVRVGSDYVFLRPAFPFERWASAPLVAVHAT